MLEFKIKTPKAGTKAAGVTPTYTKRALPRSTSREAVPSKLEFFRSMWNDPIYEVSLVDGFGSPTMWVFKTPDSESISPGEYDCVLLDSTGNQLEYLVVGVDYFEPGVGVNEDHFEYQELF